METNISVQIKFIFYVFIYMSRTHQSALTDSIKLRVACIIGDGETIHALVQSNPSLVNEPLEYGKTPLCIAAGWGQKDICKFVLLFMNNIFTIQLLLRIFMLLIRYLLDNKADVNHTDDLGWTPLHWAAFQGQTETCKLLIDHNADVKIENKAHQTALDFEKVKEIRG